MADLISSSKSYQDLLARSRRHFVAAEIPHAAPTLIVNLRGGQVWKRFWSDVPDPRGNHCQPA